MSDLDIDLGSTSEHGPDTRSRAVRAVLSEATDAAEATTFLQMLGLDAAEALHTLPRKKNDR